MALEIESAYGGKVIMIMHSKGSAQRFSARDVAKIRERITAVAKEKEEVETLVVDPNIVDPMITKLHQARLDLGWERVNLSNIMHWPSSERIREYEEGIIIPRLDTLRGWAFLLGHHPEMVKDDA